MTTAVELRPARPQDLPAIGRIYAHYVENTVATFELTPPGPAEWSRRLEAIAAAGLPFITATVDGEVAGYAYCGPWKSRPAYRRTVEDSVYVAPDAHGRGIGGRLVDELLTRCARAGARQVIAVIVDADGAASVALHRNRGFVEAGRLHAVGFKHDRWLDTVLLQRSLIG
ncbi:phosphinothricin acetyltransferase [Mycolicibacterium rutilum]|uniref:Phosphinothricin acetyltransferase n=1 Tax=Mycolicibacterium rutilum TaxID=370526 RepID=A0A1H6KXW2_MYCRU|nr:GNAT family N-acetyltransferase [Mycolicibacterium rutilum]SEH77823.1 phosphinothricin acetyltransferase [Mycolicibacterium rutilum]